MNGPSNAPGVPLQPPPANRAGEIAQGCVRIARERVRQYGVEGYTPEHDDAHTELELVKAADCYLCEVMAPRDYDRALKHPPPMWPWERSAWKPSDLDPIRNLEKAGALIAAEIDRRLRLQAKEEAK